MIPSELRKKARESLSGKWGKGACIILAYLLINFLISFVIGLFKNNSAISTILSIAEIVISVPISFGLIISFLKLKRDEDTSAFAFLENGFSRFSKAWGIAFQTIIRMILPIVCVILSVLLMVLLFFMSSKSWLFVILGVAIYIASIVYAVSRGLLYSLAYFIAYDNPNLSSKECVLKSEELMTGNRGNLFLLELSFIGWMILGAFTFGIAYIWLIPYMQVAISCFYDELNPSTAKKVDGKVEIETEE